MNWECSDKDSVAFIHDILPLTCLSTQFVTLSVQITCATVDLAVYYSDFDIRPALVQIEPDQTHQGERDQFEFYCIDYHLSYMLMSFCMKYKTVQSNTSFGRTCGIVILGEEWGITCLSY